MSRNRGPKKNKKGRLAWRNRSANRGRKGALGKRAHFPRWQEVRAHIRRRATVIIVPPKAEASNEASEA